MISPIVGPIVGNLTRPITGYAQGGGPDPTLRISGSPSSAYFGVPYSWAPTTAGGTLPYTFTKPAGTLPAWATFNSATGGWDGTPNAVATTSGITVTVTDSVAATASLVGISMTTNAVAPGAPTIGVVNGGLKSASVAFTAPASNGGATITGYTVTSSPGGYTASGVSSPISVTGLADSTAYTFTVTATNSAGTGVASAASATANTATVPGAPTIGAATAGNAQASVAFIAPGSNGGSAITGYTVTSSPGGFTGTGAASPIVVTGLTNSTAYTFTVTATNAVGTGSASAASNSVTPAASVFTPDATFFAGANGVALDPYNYATMFQDSAGATPVTANSQTLGKLNDISGNGSNFTQSTSSQRPLTAAIGFTQDGVDDIMSAAVTFPSYGAFPWAATFTLVMRLRLDSGTGNVFFWGDVNFAIFAAISGSTSTVNDSGQTTIGAITVDGVSVTNTRGALWTALTAGSGLHTLVIKDIAFNSTPWNNIVRFSGYAGADGASARGRLVLIERILSAPDLAKVVAWAEAKP